MNNVYELIKKGIREKKPYSFNEVIMDVKLNQNESPYDVPEYVKQKVFERFVSRAWNRYPSINGLPLRKAIGAYLNIPVERLAVGVGSGELLENVASIVLGSDKTAFIVEPTFQVYRQLALVNESQLLTRELSADFSYPVDEIVRVLRDNKIDLFIIAAPNNPTGTPIDVDALEYIIKSAGGFVCVDEAYFEFSGVTVTRLSSGIKKEPYSENEALETSENI